MQDVVNYFPKVEKNGFILLSNVFITVNGKQLKKRAFKALYDTCNIVCEIDYGNTVLFQKK